MEDVILNEKHVEMVVSLLETFCETKGDIPADFLQQYMPSCVINAQDKMIVSKLFLKVTRHMKFLEELVDDFYKTFKRTILNDKYLLLVLHYIIIFTINSNDLEHVAHLLKSINLNKGVHLSLYFSNESTILKMTQIGNKYFDRDYVKDVILERVLKEENIFKVLNTILQKEKVAAKPKKPKLTKPQMLKVLTHIQKVPRAPCNSRETECRIRPKPIPSSLYTSPKELGNLEVAREGNKVAAMKLYIEAQRKTAPRLIQPLRSSSPPLSLPPEVRTTPHKPLPVPDFSQPELPVKQNTTTVLREAARIVKSEEKEVNRLKKLLGGALDCTMFENLFMELKNKEEEESILMIEKKHLKGQLTYEEAIIAKKNIVQTNKDKRVQFEKEREKLEELLKEWRRKEEEKMQRMIEKGQQIHRAAEEKKKEVFEQKQKDARELNEKTRVLMLKIIKQQQEELSRKIALIKEIRMLQSFRIIPKKEFDATETMNIGLLCEMSYAELTERLTILTAEMQEELEVRRKRIKQKKSRQCELLEEMESLILFAREERKIHMKEKEEKKVKPAADKEILDLRKKLEEARDKRKASITC